MVVATEAIAEVAATVEAAAAEAEAINAGSPPKNERHFDPVQQGFLNSFQSVPGASLESLENAVFPFASRRGLKYLLALHHRWVCRFHDCLFLQRPQRPRCPQCRQRSRTSFRAMPSRSMAASAAAPNVADARAPSRPLSTRRSALAPKACCSGCPHSQAGTHQHGRYRVCARCLLKIDIVGFYGLWPLRE